MTSSTALLLGHRGARGEYIENSQYGFERIQDFYLANLSPTVAKDTLLVPKIFDKPHELDTFYVQRQLIGVEFDVQLTADAVLVVTHDDTLERFYQQQERIDQLTYTELMRRTRHILPIIRLQDLLPLLVGYERIELEIKTHARSALASIVQALVDTLCAPTNAHYVKQLPITLTSFDVHLHSYLQNCTALSCHSRGLLIDKYTLTMTTGFDVANKQKSIQGVSANINLAQRLGCQHISFHHSILTPKAVTHCQRHGLTTSAWTVNSAQRIDYLASIGVNFIITDYPCKFST